MFNIQISILVYYYEAATTYPEGPADQEHREIRLSQALPLDQGCRSVHADLQHRDHLSGLMVRGVHNYRPYPTNSKQNKVLYRITIEFKIKYSIEVMATWTPS